MKQLSNELLDQGKQSLQALPEKVLQFGTGNFLRGFLDWQVDVMNKHDLFQGRIVVIQSTKNGTVNTLNDQEGLYTLYLQGIKEGEPVSEYDVIQSISRGLDITTDYDEYITLAQNPSLRFIFSNTTEAGIRFSHEDTSIDEPQSSFPGKLTAFLYKRFQFFKGDLSKGFIIFPCELIEDNGLELKRIILEYANSWELEDDFVNWLHHANTFCNTLVDRIVPGFPKDTIQEKTTELGYRDDLIVVGEQFHLFVIEGPQFVKDEFPAELVGLNVHVVDDLKPYRLKKVRILNGAHTVMTPVSFLAGLNTVHDAVTVELSKEFINYVVYNEIVPTLTFPEEELLQFANDVMNRFKNPYIQHYLSSISLNSISKFKTRVVPTLLEYSEKYHKLPKGIVFSLSALLLFYRGKRGCEEIVLVDDEYALKKLNLEWEHFNNQTESIEQIVINLLSDHRLWGTDLAKLESLTNKVTFYLDSMISNGVKDSIKLFLKGEVNESVY